MTGDWVDLKRAAFGHLSTMQVANKVRMLMRNDLDHEPVCVAARDRIMHLDQQNLQWRKIAEACSVAQYKTDACAIYCRADEYVAEHGQLPEDLTEIIHGTCNEG